MSDLTYSTITYKFQHPFLQKPDYILWLHKKYVQANVLKKVYVSVCVCVTVSDSVNEGDGMSVSLQVIEGSVCLWLKEI